MRPVHSKVVAGVISLFASAATALIILKVEPGGFSAAKSPYETVGVVGRETRQCEDFAGLCVHHHGCAGFFTTHSGSEGAFGFLLEANVQIEVQCRPFDWRMFLKLALHDIGRVHLYDADTLAALQYQRVG